MLRCWSVSEADCSASATCQYFMGRCMGWNWSLLLSQQRRRILRIIKCCYSNTSMWQKNRVCRTFSVNFSVDADKLKCNLGVKFSCCALCKNKNRSIQINTSFNAIHNRRVDIQVMRIEHWPLWRHSDTRQITNQTCNRTFITVLKLLSLRCL